MICIYCLNKKTAVPNSRPHKTAAKVWRRRTCPSCTKVFTTYESPSLEDVAVINQTSARTAFSRGKLTVSIYRSLSPQFSQKAGSISYELAQTVEQQLLLHYDLTAAVTASAIADMTYRTLKKFDEISALQYGASHNIVTSIRRRGRPSTTATSSDDVPELA